MIHDHFFSMEEGVVTGQDQSVAYIREQDEGKVDSAKALNKKMKKYPKDIELLPSDNDFIHIIGGKANPKNVVSRAYISAKATNKSEAAGLFMKTLRELNYENDVYTENRKLLPKIKDLVEYNGNKYEVVDVDVLNKKYYIKIDDSEIKEIDVK